MKTPNKIYALIFIVVMMILLSGCSNDDCNQDCGTVYSASVWIGIPAWGDEFYIIKYATECGELITHRVSFDGSQGFPGETNQPLKLYKEGDKFCR
jgi:hypothetical protein